MSFHPSSPYSHYTLPLHTNTHVVSLSSLTQYCSFFVGGGAYLFLFWVHPPELTTKCSPDFPTAHIQLSFIEGVQRDLRAAHTDNINVLSFL